ncbi:alpha/beta hydrolase [Actinoplanes sp. CA-142083]|uniref:alpha/beta hydrolase n=1 Tax=Actinoplanes sp. CA-142083 TaxID=3239903 RepID=UPI003D930B75
MPDAVVIPGGQLGPAAGLLMYAAAVPERRGATVHRHSWSRQPVDLLERQIESWVGNEIAPLLGSLGGKPLLIGKSLGTNAAALAAEQSLPAVWLTPVLTVPWIVDALRRATAPFLLVGGTADPLWDGPLARRLSPHVFEIEEADHGMQVPGPLLDSIAALGRTVTAIDQFLDTIHWPPRQPCTPRRLTPGR